MREILLKKMMNKINLARAHRDRSQLLRFLLMQGKMPNNEVLQVLQSVIEQSNTRVLTTKERLLYKIYIQPFLLKKCQCCQEGFMSPSELLRAYKKEDSLMGLFCRRCEGQHFESRKYYSDKCS